MQYKMESGVAHSVPHTVDGIVAYVHHMGAWCCLHIDHMLGAHSAPQKNMWAVHIVQGIALTQHISTTGTTHGAALDVRYLRA